MLPYKSLSKTQKIAVIMMEARRIVNGCVSDDPRHWENIDKKLIGNVKFLLFMLDNDPTAVNKTTVIALTKQVLDDIREAAKDTVAQIPWPIDVSLSRTLKLLKESPSKPYLSLET